MWDRRVPGRRFSVIFGENQDWYKSTVTVTYIIICVTSVPEKSGATVNKLGA
jgi:hypothetical protein